MTQIYDVLIIGGGMVGASLARAISGHGLRIGVVEAYAYNDDNQPSFDDRVLALSWGSRLILQGMGLWSALAPDAQDITDIHISERGQCGFTRLHSREEQVEALGYVMTARDLGRVLSAGLTNLPDLELICPARLVNLELNPAQVDLTIDHQGSHQHISARLLVAADGGDSRIREILQLPVRESTYGQTAIIANVATQQPHQGVAFERFTDTGPLALLPMRDDRCSLVWTARDEQVSELMALDDQVFLERLQERFGFRLGRITRIGKRAAYPLRLRQVKEQIRPRVVLIGNAAHAVHPVTGQGFNLGLRDVAALADVLADVAAAGGDPGAMDHLRSYARWREPDQSRVALLTDTLARVFANPLHPLRAARNLALLGLDLSPPLKHLVARQFMGLNGRLPRLARGVPLV